MARTDRLIAQLQEGLYRYPLYFLCILNLCLISCLGGEEKEDGSGLFDKDEYNKQVEAMVDQVTTEVKIIEITF